MSAPSEADQALRERIKLAIMTAQGQDGDLLQVIAPAIAGMYADAIMRVLTDRTGAEQWLSEHDAERRHPLP